MTGSGIRDWELDAAIRIAVFRSYAMQYTEQVRREGDWEEYDKMVQLVKSSSWSKMWGHAAQVMGETVRMHRVFEEDEIDS